MEAVGERCGHNCKLGHHQVCPQFFAGCRNGTIVISEKRDGWHSLDMPLRKMSWRGRYYGIPRGCPDNTGRHYLIEHCPFCGGSVPDVVPSIVGQCDGDGEE